MEEREREMRESLTQSLSCIQEREFDNIAHAGLALAQSFYAHKTPKNGKEKKHNWLPASG